MISNFDIVIVGNGVLSLITALSLVTKNPKINISIVGNFSRDGAGSGAAGAMLNYIGEVTSETLGNEYSRKKLEISIEASKKWPNLIEFINSHLSDSDHIHYIPGTVVILNSKSGSLDSDNYEAIIDAAKIYNEPVEEIHSKDIRGLNPLDDCRPLRSLFLKNEGSVDANSVLRALTLIISKYPQIQLIDDNVQKIIFKENSVQGVQIKKNNSVIFGDKVLLAAGSYNQYLIDQIPEISGKIPRILSGVGISCVISQHQTNPIEYVIRTPNRSGACGLHVLPRSNNSLYIGATNNIAFSPSVQNKLGLSQFLMQCAIDQINQDIYSSDIYSWHVGNRPVSVDTFPIAGKTSINNLYMLTGTYRDGFQQAPFWGEYMAKIMLGEQYNPLPFEPERKLITTLSSKEESIRTVVSHYMAGFYEHGMRLARLFPEEKFEELLTIKFSQIYEALDTDIPLKPDILFLFELSQNNNRNIEFFREWFKQTNYNR